jgi:hypothetical protein
MRNLIDKLHLIENASVLNQYADELKPLFDEETRPMPLEVAQGWAEKYIRSITPALGREDRIRWLLKHKVVAMAYTSDRARDALKIAPFAWYGAQMVKQVLDEHFNIEELFKMQQEFDMYPAMDAVRWDLQKQPTDLKKELDRAKTKRST